MDIGKILEFVLILYILYMIYRNDVKIEEIKKHLGIKKTDSVGFLVIV